MSNGKQVIIVTGACGRIGAAVCRRFADKYRVVGLELLNAFYASASEELVPCDLGSEESVHQAMAHIKNFYGTKIAAVIHLAAYYSFSGKNPELYDKITVMGTKRLIDNLKKFDFEVEQFIFSSTMLVHAPTDPGRKINEDSPVIPKWDYPLSKVKTEHLLHNERGNMKTVIMRISGVYDDECHSIPISQQIQRIYEKQLNAYLFAGDLTHGAPFMHMDDLVDAIEQSFNLRHELPPELTILLAEPIVYSYEYLQKRISTLIWGEPIKTISVPKPMAKMGAWGQNLILKNAFIKPWMIDLADDHYDVDITRAKEYLKWWPKHDLDKTLPIMIDLLKKDPVRWYQLNGIKMPEHIKRKIDESGRP